MDTLNKTLPAAFRTGEMALLDEDLLDSVPNSLDLFRFPRELIRRPEPI